MGLPVDAVCQQMSVKTQMLLLYSLKEIIIITLFCSSLICASYQGRYFLINSTLINYAIKYIEFILFCKQNEETQKLI